ncbi:MAG: NTP transferase domain-containing protein [Helicobacter sp.]|nr:NTP transferase domain-containing protein [Helicobacter sp.]
MQAALSVVISCAGIGSRLGLNSTKALINIHGKSLISWQLELFKNVQDVRVVVGFQSLLVMEEVLRHRKDVVFVYNHNYFETKTGASYYLGAKDANEFVMEYDGDLLVRPTDMQKLLEQSGEWIAYSNICSSEPVFVKLASSGNIESFSRSHGDYEWVGPCCVRKNRLKYTSGNVYNQLESMLPLRGIQVEAVDIDTYEDYQNALEILKGWQ